MESISFQYIVNSGVHLRLIGAALGFVLPLAGGVTAWQMS